MLIVSRIRKTKFPLKIVYKTSFCKFIVYSVYFLFVLYYLSVVYVSSQIVNAALFLFVYQ